MHYKDGQEAKLGDTAKFPADHWTPTGCSKVEKQGVLVSLSPGSDRCNGSIAYPNVQRGGDGTLQVATIVTTTVTIGECELVVRA